MATKETSSRISTIAAKCMKHPQKATHADIKALAASCLSQDETKGQGIWHKEKAAIKNMLGLK